MTNFFKHKKFRTRKDILGIYFENKREFEFNFRFKKNLPRMEIWLNSF